MEIRVGKKRTIAIPKNIAEALGIDEGSKPVLEVKEWVHCAKARSRRHIPVPTQREDS